MALQRDKGEVRRLLLRWALVVTAIAVPLLVIAMNGKTLDRRSARLLRKPGEPYTVRYTVHFEGEPDARTHIQMTVSGLRGVSSLQVQMPAWSPGEYRIQNFARHIEAMQTAGGGTVRRVDANTWEVRTEGQESVTLSYALPNMPPGLFTENMRIADTWAFVHGPAAFLYVVGHSEAPITLTVQPPLGWQVASPLEPAEGEANVFFAPDYDTLADAPLVAGQLEQRDFTVAGVRHSIVCFHQPAGFDLDAFAVLLKPIIEAQLAIFGGEPPYERYVFFCDVGGRGGGLEHGNSCRLFAAPGTPPRALAQLAAHEFFHLWNVKRFRPAVLAPFDYQRPAKTRNLWFCEGVTEYYAKRSLLRAGLFTPQEYLRSLVGAMLRMQRNPSRLHITADESSRRVWEAGGSSGYGGLNFYTKGELIGLCLDLKIRHVTRNRKSLDDLMRSLLAQYGAPQSGYPEDGLRDALRVVTGKNLNAFYDRLCRSTEELPFAECLGYAGLSLHSATEIRLDREPSEMQAVIRQAWLGLPAL